MKAVNIDYSIKSTVEGEEAQSYKVSINFPESVEEAVQQWGEELVLNKCLAQVKIDARRLCYEAENEERAQEMVNSFTPGVGKERTSSGISKKALYALLKGKSKEEIVALEAYLKQL